MAQPPAGTELAGCVDRGLCVLGDNLSALARTADASVDLVYVDPPFNTGAPRRLTRLRTERDVDGDRVGFGGRRYRSTVMGTEAYPDRRADWLGWLRPRLVELRRVLAAHGSLYLHLDQREAHRAKLLCDEVFGRRAFLNEIIWAYDFGGRSQRSWASKHDTILVYVRTPGGHHFDPSEVDRLPYLAPNLVGAEKAARGKLPTDVWWHTIVPTAGRERTGYPTQKPLGILRRIVAASSPSGGLVADVFAGSGTAGAAALELGRRFLLVDDNPAALEVQRRRFADEPGVRFIAV